MTTLDDTPVGQRRGTVAELEAVRTDMRRGPSGKATGTQHAKGRLTARERLRLLFGEGRSTEVEGLRRHRAGGFGPQDERPCTDGVVTARPWAQVYAHPRPGSEREGS